MQFRHRALIFSTRFSIFKVIYQVDHFNYTSIRPPSRTYRCASLSLYEDSLLTPAQSSFLTELRYTSLQSNGFFARSIQKSEQMPSTEASASVTEQNQASSVEPHSSNQSGPSHLHAQLPDIDSNAFFSADLRVGTITGVKPNKKARAPAYILTVDFGQTLGVRTSSAQITHNYQMDSLVGRQIVAVVNLGVRRIGGVKSEVLVLGVDKLGDGVISLLGVDGSTPNGTRIS
ncbi:uncharacterized protein V2V93DRAFT_366681 [Kockiozyma suomiensis]|uniref:uncharacterized protein n=1 Tax=Kockiozyma suomiensis TaxID=1337062 RepID=UPI0033440973